MSEPILLHWTENQQAQTARWQSAAGYAPPKKLQVVGDQLDADTAYRLANEGYGLIWRGDFQNARQLLNALIRRLSRKPAKKAATLNEQFHLYRMAQSQRARILGMLLVPLEADYTIPLRRAPDWQQACTEAWGKPAHRGPALVSLRELLGLNGAHEWRKNGVEVPALEGRIHPHYGVFSPIRGEYLDLVAEAPLNHKSLAFDIGTGTGVLAALLVKRGFKRVIGTDLDPRALACASENLSRLGYRDWVQLLEKDLFPDGEADLVICNPPWLPGRPATPLENAIYDPESRMLKGFLAGLKNHLKPRGQGWLILSDLAEQLGLRERNALQTWINEGGLKVIQRHDIRPRHSKAQDREDPLYEARSAETTSLWRLARA